MKKLKVMVTLPHGEKLFCGEILTAKPDTRGAIQGAFRYTPSYLNHQHRFALDPVNLPLAAKEFQAERPEGIHSVFEDALPDAWGRQLLIKRADLKRNEQNAPKLLEILGQNGLGALSFFSETKNHDLNNFSAPVADLKDLYDAAVKYDAGIMPDKNHMELLFRHGSTPGGARPKGLIKKQDNSLWIAKFPMANDKFSVEQLEAATLELAKISGLLIPDFELVKIGKRKILLVKRFDIADSKGRYHMISMQTLLNAHGYYYVNYSELFEIIKHHSCQPSIDLEMLFTQMVFNVAVGNTDDHLKNFCMLYKNFGYCISPAYDLLPDIYEKKEHTLAFPHGQGYLPPGRSGIEETGRIYKIKNSAKIIDRVVDAMFKWEKVFKKYDVPDQEIKRLKQDINKRIKALEK